VGLLPPDVPCIGMHRASFAPRDPPRTPTAKDFAEEGRPIEIRQSPWLGAPNRPESRRDKFDLLALDKRNQIADDGARFIRLVRFWGNHSVEPPQTQNFLAGKSRGWFRSARDEAGFCPTPRVGRVSRQKARAHERLCDHPATAIAPSSCPCSSNARASRARATVRIARGQADRGHPFPGLQASSNVLAPAMLRLRCDGRGPERV
jgi:hypothetical protein